MTAKSIWLSFLLMWALRWSKVSCGCLFVVKSSTTVTVGFVASLIWPSKAFLSASGFVHSSSVKSRFPIHFRVLLESAAVSSVRHLSLPSFSSLFRWMWCAQMWIIHLSFYCLKVPWPFSISKSGSFMLDRRADSGLCTESRLTCVVKAETKEIWR